MSTESWQDYFSLRRIVLWLLALAVLAVVFPTALKVIFAADDEVSYSAGLSMTTCSGFLANDRGGDDCVARYEMVLGNTGSQPQPRIEIRFAPVSILGHINYQALSIVASANRSVSPEISYSQEGEILLFVVENLAPNRLVEIDFDARGRGPAEQLAFAEAQIRGPATVIESNPRLTVVSRFVRNLFSAFGV